jgi:class 3 adenylate cyclase
VVPDEDSIQLGNDCVDLEGVVLYADLAASTNLVKQQTATFAAEIYKTFLHCAGKIIREESGTITAYDGDRIMAVFIDGAKHTNAVRAAMKINCTNPLCGNSVVPTVLRRALTHDLPSGVPSLK